MNQDNFSERLTDLPQPLPSFPDADGSAGAVVDGDAPQPLPSFPDVDGSGGAVYPDNGRPLPLPIFPSPVPPISQPNYQPSNRTCRVRFFHAAAQAGPINISVGSQRAASNLSFGNFSPYFCYSEGFRSISLINARTGRTVLLRKTVAFHAGDTLTFAVVNNASSGALELVTINDASCSGQLGGFACIRMANLLLGDNALDLLLPDGRTLFSDVRYKEATLSRRLRPGSYSFLLANTPSRIEPRIVDVELDDSSYRISERYLPGYGELDPLLSLSMQVRRGVMYTLYVIGQANIGEIQVVIAEN